MRVPFLRSKRMKSYLCLGIPHKSIFLFWNRGSKINIDAGPHKNERWRGVNINVLIIDLSFNLCFFEVDSMILNMMKQKFDWTYIRKVWDFGFYSSTKTCHTFLIFVKLWFLFYFQIKTKIQRRDPIGTFKGLFWVSGRIMEEILWITTSAFVLVFAKRAPWLFLFSLDIRDYCQGLGGSEGACKYN